MKETKKIINSLKGKKTVAKAAKEKVKEMVEKKSGGSWIQ